MWKTSGVLHCLSSLFCGLQKFNYSPSLRLDNFPLLFTHEEGSWRAPIKIPDLNPAVPPPADGCASFICICIPCDIECKRPSVFDGCRRHDMCTRMRAPRNRVLHNSVPQIARDAHRSPCILLLGDSPKAVVGKIEAYCERIHLFNKMIIKAIARKNLFIDFSDIWIIKYWWIQKFVKGRSPFS